MVGRLNAGRACRAGHTCSGVIFSLLKSMSELLFTCGGQIRAQSVNGDRPWREQGVQSQVWCGDVLVGVRGLVAVPALDHDVHDVLVHLVRRGLPPKRETRNRGRQTKKSSVRYHTCVRAKEIRLTNGPRRRRCPRQGGGRPGRPGWPGQT